jgi:SAM-dependent methyltransferase
MIVEGRRRFEDDDAHVALVTRTLRLEPSAWREVVTRWCEAGTAEEPESRRLEDLTVALHRPRSSPLLTRPCLVCGATASCCDDDGVLRWLRCEACGHGALLDGAPPRYDAAYYATRTPGGVGYDAYLAEREYREGKGRALVSELLQRHGGAPRSMLEVGSGFGFTRAAAKGLGLTTTGVDVNPAAAEGARQLYGFETTVGTANRVDPSHRFDLVLYQFVLEHISDVRAELKTARQRSREGGLGCFVVPSMDATERRVFGSRYRSYRADHLHLFSRASVTRLLLEAGFVDVQLRSVCNLHLLGPFLSNGELANLYARGEGPDLIVTARSP